MFHASLLKHAAADPFLNQRQDDLRPPVIMVNGEEEWEVERILRKRTKGRQRQVLVKWKGYLNPRWELWRASARIILFPALGRNLPY